MAYSLLNALRVRRGGDGDRSGHGGALELVPGEMNVLALDTETHLIAPGNPAPRLVCGSWAGEDPLCDCGDGCDKCGAEYGGACEPGCTGTSKCWGPHEGILSREAVLDRFHQWFERAAKGRLTLVFANAPFDLGVLAAEDPRLLPLIFRALERGTIKDIISRMALIDIGRGCLFKDYETGLPLRDPETNKVKDRYSLSVISKILRGVTVQKTDTWRLRYGELDGVPLEQYPPEAKEYPIRDATETLANYLEQEGGPNLHEEARTNQANWALHLMRMWGVRTDPERVEPLAAAVRQRHEESRRQFFEEGIVRVRPCTKKDGEWEKADDITPAWLDDAYTLLSGLETEAWVVRRMEDIVSCRKALGKGRPIRFATDNGRLQELVTAAYLGSPPMTEKGNVQADRDALKESGDTLLEAYADSGEEETLHRTFIDPLELGLRCPINPEWNGLVETGRTSCKYPNLQNLPRGMDQEKLAARVREAFIPRPGFVYASVDYSAIEMVTLAQTNLWLFGWSRLAEALKEGKKPHELLAAKMLGITYEEMLARYAAKDKQAKVFRQFAKIGNFGLAGGMGPDKLVRSARNQGVKFCEAQGAPKCGVEKVLDNSGKPICVVCRKIAQDIKAAYLALWEEMPHYFKRVELECEHPDGGTIQVMPDGIVVARRSYNAAANLRFQGLAARLAKHALWMVSKECYVDPLSPLYGSRPVLFVHDEIICEVPEAKAHEAAHRLAEVMLNSLKEHCPDVPGEAKPALARRWYKGMETVLKDGRLIPWEPEIKKVA